MDFQFTDEQQMLADSASRYVRDRCDLETRRNTAKTGKGFSPQHWQHFAEQGWLALTLPEDFGGLGLDITDMVILMEELGRGLVIEPIIDSSILCGNLLSSSNNTAIKEDLLPEIASGEALLALAHTEDEGRSEYDTPITTTAVKTDAGWLLNGIKHRVFYGNAATHFIVSAQSPLSQDTQSQSIHLFVIKSDTTGITRDDYSLIDSTQAADVRLDNVLVPTSALIHDPHTAAISLEQALDQAIIAASASALGSMEAVLVMTADYLKTREQYGQPLSKFQALKHRMSEMLVETEQARSILFSALSEQGNSNTKQQNAAVSGAKALIAQSGLFVTAQGIQLHGGIGVTEEYAAAHHYKALQTYDKRFGDRDFHLERYDAITFGSEAN